MREVPLSCCIDHLTPAMITKLLPFLREGVPELAKFGKTSNRSLRAGISWIIVDDNSPLVASLCEFLAAPAV